jgi:hypothetical protein
MENWEFINPKLHYSNTPAQSYGHLESSLAAAIPRSG